MVTKFQISGEWFLPGRENLKIAGTLFFDPDEKAELQLYGSYSSEVMSIEFRVDDFILGISSDSKLITLYKTFVIKPGGMSSSSHTGSVKPHDKYRVRYILIGGHFENEDQLCFNNISSNLFNMEQWMATSGFADDSFDLEKINKREFNIRYKLPDDINFKVDESTNGKFSFSVSVPMFERLPQNKTITQTVAFVVESKQPKSLEEMLSYTYKFQSFISLALYSPTFPTTITLQSDSLVGQNKRLSQRTPVYLHHILPIGYTKLKLKENPDMIFDFQRISTEFSQIIETWYSNYDLLEPAVNILYDHFLNKSLFTVNTFLNLAQAAETFHARINSEPNRNQIERLEEMVDKYSNVVLDDIIGNKEKFTKQVRDSRNYYTHYSLKLEMKALKGKDLYILTEKLKVLMVCAFLNESKFSNDKIGDLLKGVKWRLFNHLKD